MERKSLLGLAACYFVAFVLGNGFLPLMPIYAQNLGATREIAGYYVAFAFLCVSAGALLGGRMSDFVPNRRLIIALAGALAMPVTALMSTVTNVWQLALTTGGQWLLLGVCLGTVGSIAGRNANETQRGQVFGVLGMMISLGALVGGMTFGRIVDSWGYPALFISMAVFLSIVPMAALLLVRDDSAAAPPSVASARVQPLRLGPAFWLLLAAEVLAMAAGGAGNMGKSLSMNADAFANSAITATMAVGGLVSLPLPFALGWLSDRVGRKGVMIASFVAGIASLLLLTVSHSLWQFSTAAALLSLHAISMSLGPALVADLVRRERIGTGVSLFQSAVWIGTIVGYMYSGFAFPRLGMLPALAVGSLFPLVAILLTAFIRTSAGLRRPEKAHA